MIRTLGSLIILAAVFAIELRAHWIPSEENIVADDASRFDFEKLANLGVARAFYRRLTPVVKLSILLRHLTTFFIFPSPPPLSKNTPAPTKLSAEVGTRRTPPPSQTGLPPLRQESGPRCSKGMRLPSAQCTSAAAAGFHDPQIDLVIHGAKRLYDAGESRLRLPLTDDLLLRILP